MSRVTSCTLAEQPIGGGKVPNGGVLWQPKGGDIRKIGAMPTLGSGKLDLRRIRVLAAGRDA